MSNLISVEEALESILGCFSPLAAEQAPLLSALDRVLAEDVTAATSIPPFDNSAMDGYAVVAADTAQVPITLRVVGHIAAGDTIELTRVRAGEAVRIMTGAPVPPGADAIVRFEQTVIETPDTAVLQHPQGDEVQVLASVRAGDNVRRAGEDVTAGQVVLRAGALVRPPEIAMLAALGFGRVWVHRRPRVAILATGDELIGIDELLSPGKIRNVNEYSSAAMVLRCGGEPLCLGIARDRMEHLRAKVEEGLALRPDLFVTSAGVSVGDFDMVKDVLASEGRMEFWSVAMKPGKPMAFGNVRGVPLIGLPGNPVAAMISFDQFVRPAILKMAGRRSWRKPAVRALAEDDIENSGRRNYVRATVERRGDTYYARTTGEQGSGMLSSLVRANGLMVVPEGVTHVRAGESIEVQMLDWNENYF
jgi:molybdopterin molybdotransferase